VAIALAGFLPYSGTFDFPFHFDDYPNVVENPVVKDLSIFLHPSRAENYRLYDLFKSRYIGCLTFALNYRVHALDVWGYHAVNVSVHIASAVLLYLLVALAMRTPFFRGRAGEGEAAFAAFFSGLLFAVHPVQTQAVTYIVQRFASMATAFYLLSLVFYVRARLGAGRISYALGLLSALLALKTKETAVTLPLVLLLYEFFFFEGPVKRRLLGLLPFFLLTLAVPISLVGAESPLAGATAFSRVGETEASRLDYLMTEMRVVVTYLRLVALPINQNVDYSYPSFGSFFEPGVLLSAILVAGPVVAATTIFRNSKDRPLLRLASFGLSWFFIALLPESSLIPIADVIFEHRLYLPMAGAAMVVPALALAAATPAWRGRLAALLSAATVLLALLAYGRNLVWKDDIALWGDAARKSAKGRPLNNLGLALMDAGREEEAIAAYRQALSVEPDYAEASVNLAIAYWDKGLRSETVRVLKKSIDVKPTSEAHYNLGVAYIKLGRPDMAMEHLRQAILYDRGSASAYAALGSAYLAVGDTAKAVRILKEGASRLPGYPELYLGLGRAYLASGDREAAHRTYLSLKALDPVRAEELRLLIEGR
jgi:tetratricopeptide (TPR) repeat protein